MILVLARKATSLILASLILLSLFATGVTVAADSSSTVYNHYFGQLHNHTRHSRGDQEGTSVNFGTLSDAYTWARYTAGMDFFAVTDHSDFYYNDMGDPWRPADYPWSESNPWTFDGSWREIKAAEASVSAVSPGFNDAGSFVAIGGYEMTWATTSKFGHINMLNTADFATARDPWRDINPRLNQAFNPNPNPDPDLDFAINQGDPFNYNSTVDSDPAFKGLQNYYNYLTTLGVPSDKNTLPTGQFNHPGTYYGAFNNFDYWTPEIDRVMTLIEVGNRDFRYNDPWYDMALSKGWHVAPTNGHDNHDGYPHADNGHRTVVMAESLSRENIYDAFRSRRVYSTEISDFKLTYTANGKPMGSVIDDKMPDALEFEININSAKITSGTDSKVSIIAGNSLGYEEIFKGSITGNSGISYTLHNPGHRYFYVKIETGVTKKLTISAPVCIEAPQTAVMRIDKKRALINGRGVEISGGLTPVFSAEGRTMVPFRFLSEAFDARVKWDDATGSVIVKYKGDTVVVPIDQNYITFNGKKVATDAPAQLININGTLRTFVPLRVITEILGFKVKYDMDTGTIVASEEEIDMPKCVAAFNLLLSSV